MMFWERAHDRHQFRRRRLNVAVALSALLFLSRCGFGESDFGPVVTPYCGTNERVVSGQCEPCPDGLVSAAGASKSGSDTVCNCPTGLETDPSDPDGLTCVPAICGENQRVLSNVCVDCTGGTGRPAGDVATGPDTECAPIACPANTRVVANACVACPAFSTNEAGDDATGDNTLCDCLPGSVANGESCDATICGPDERVINNACVSVRRGLRLSAPPCRS